MGGMLFAPHGHFAATKLTVERSWREVPPEVAVTVGE